MTVTLSSSVGISLRNNPTVIKFYPEKTSAEIELYINDDTLWLLGTTTNLILTPQNTNTYASAVSIPLTAAAAVTGVPTLTLTVPSTGLKTATFTVSCSEHGRFVYHISREFAYNTTACSLSIDNIAHWIQQSSIDGLRVDETYY